MHFAEYIKRVERKLYAVDMTLGKLTVRMHWKLPLTVHVSLMTKWKPNALRIGWIASCRGDCMCKIKRLCSTISILDQILIANNILFSYQKLRSGDSNFFTSSRSSDVIILTSQFPRIAVHYIIMLCTSPYLKFSASHPSATILHQIRFSQIQRSSAPEISHLSTLQSLSAPTLDLA